MLSWMNMARQIWLICDARLVLLNLFANVFSQLNFCLRLPKMSLSQRVWKQIQILCALLLLFIRTNGFEEESEKYASFILNPSIIKNC